MGQSTNAVLAYGYDLGSGEEWKIAEVGEYGDLAVDWFDEDHEDGFLGQAERRLLNASGFTETYEDGKDDYFAREGEAKERLGVEFESYCSGEYPMYVLATKVITVRRGYSEVLDLPALMAEPAEHGWDDKLTAALTALGITPKQEQPGWVLCSYWG